MLKTAVLCISFNLLAFSAFSQSPQQEYLKHFQTQRVQFPAEDSHLLADSPGRHPAWMNFALQNIFDWNPRGERAVYTQNCDPEVWSMRLQDSRLNSAALQGALIQKYFQDCEAELSTGTNSEFMNSLKMMSMRYDPQHHPFLHRVVFNLPGSIKLKGLLALKGDMRKRPMVVVRLGIFSSVEEFYPERYLLMQLFEQSPFNVLILENMSSPDFIANNAQFSFGGYDEGLQNILVARLLRDQQEPLSQVVGSVHFVGVSLGGHGVFYSSQLNDINENGKLIQSFLGICPVANLQPTMQKFSETSLTKPFLNYWFSMRLQGLTQKVPSLEKASSFNFSQELIDLMTRTYRGGLSYVSSIVLPAGQTDATDFWKQNDFWKQYEDVNSQVLVLATENDPMVPYAINAGTLKKKNIKSVVLKQGLHCTLPVPYHWDAITSLLQGYILSHAPDFKLITQGMQVDVTEEKIPQLAGRLPFTVSFPKGSERYVRIAISDFQLSLPIASFDFHFLNDKLSVSEQLMLERWLQQNLKIEIVPKADRRVLDISWKKI